MAEFDGNGLEIPLSDSATQDGYPVLDGDGTTVVELGDLSSSSDIVRDGAGNIILDGTEAVGGQGTPVLDGLGDTIIAGDVTPPATGDARLLESDDNRLLESDDNRLLEAAASIVTTLVGSAIIGSSFVA